MINKATGVVRCWVRVVDFQKANQPFATPFFRSQGSHRSPLVVGGAFGSY